MRTLTSAALAKLEAQATDPVIIVELTWNGLRKYSDQNLSDTGVTAEGRVMNAAGIRQQLQQGKEGSVAAVSIELSDNDKDLLTRLSSYQLEGVEARILQHYVGLTSVDLIELVKGKVGSPVVWEEDSQVLKFDVVSNIFSEDFPYTPEDSDGLDENGTWPACFGTPVDVPATRVTRPAKGHLTRELLLEDTEFEVEVDDEEFSTGNVTLNVGNEWIECSVAVSRTEPTKLLTCTILRRNVSKGTVYAENRQLMSETAQIDPRYARWSDDVEQLVGNWLLLQDENGLYFGTLESTLVSDTSSATVPSHSGQRNYIVYQNERDTRGQLPWWGASGFTYIDIGYRADVRGFQPGQYILHQAGTEVTEVGQESKYVVNALPSEQVLRVKVKRQVKLDDNGGQVTKLVTVPRTWYSVNLSETLAGHQVTTISFDTPLETRGQGWDSTLYVTLRSTVGPNTVDVIRYLLENYTSVVVDETTFDAVEEDLEPYPSHFAVLNPRDALELASDIAYQARCRLVVINGSGSLVYLAQRPTSFAALLGDENLKEAVTQISSTDTDDVVNDFRLQWWPRYSLDQAKILKGRNEDSVSQYGAKKEETEIFIYQHQALVQKTLDFWLRRRARVWRRVRLTTFMEGLTIDLLSYFQAQLGEVVFTDPFICQPEDIDQDTEIHTITFDCWTPVEVGSVGESSYAWQDETSPTITILQDEEGEDVAEAVETSPLDLTPVSSSTFVGLANVDEEDGVFNADLYTSNTATGNVEVENVEVRNLSGSEVKSGDVITVHRAQDGSYFATTQGASAATYWGTVTLVNGLTLTVSVYEVLTAASNLLGSFPVKLIGGSVAVGDTITVYKSSDGTYWTRGVTSLQIGLAKVRTNSNLGATSVSARLYQSTDLAGDGDEDITVTIPRIANTARVSAGTWIIAMQIGGDWIGYLPLTRPRTT